MSLYKGNSLLAGTNFTSFSFRDEYAETAIYKYLDIVTYEGSSYMALKTVSGVTPSDDRENWIMVAKGYSGEIGSVNVTDTYDLVGEGEGSTVDGQSFLDEVASNIVTLNDHLIDTDSNFDNYLPLTGGTVTGQTNFTGGLGTATQFFEKFGHRCHYVSGTPGSEGYINFCRIVIKGNYSNSPIIFKICQRNGAYGEILLAFSNSSDTDPTILKFTRSSSINDVVIVKADTSTWDLYIKKVESYDNVDIMDVMIPYYLASKITLTWTDTQMDSVTATQTATAV